MLMGQDKATSAASEEEHASLVEVVCIMADVGCKYCPTQDFFMSFVLQAVLVLLLNQLMSWVFLNSVTEYSASVAGPG